ncbi:MAG: peptidase M28 [Planctomycetes bacterium]|nr:peptidase M28 [Planctomycetota bacterium]
MWEQIHANKVRSVLVVTLLAVMLVACGAAAGAVLGGANAALVGAAIAFALWLIMWMTTISSGDQVLLNFAGARELPAGELPQLRNIVEEMAIAAGLDGVPKIYVIDDRAPNAFAAGRKPENAVVAVTTGLLAMLDRDELQGVIAHEIGHVKNRDVALMTTAGIMLGAIVILGEFTTRALWWGGGYRSRSSNNSNAAAAVIGVIVIVLAPILAQLLYFALSRRREYLADASGARFTRYPEGLASALEKIGGVARPQADQSRVTAPMYIVRPLRKGEKLSARRQWFATHPPIQERVRILRAMGGGAGYADYERACREVTGRSMVGARTLAEDGGAVAAVAPAQAGATPVMGLTDAAAPATPPVPPAASPRARRRRMREASDAYLSASGYAKRSCANCQAVIKIPPALRGKLRNCPRCGSAL